MKQSADKQTLKRRKNKTKIHMQMTGEDRIMIRKRIMIGKKRTQKGKKLRKLLLLLLWKKNFKTVVVKSRMTRADQRCTNAACIELKCLDRAPRLLHRIHRHSQETDAQ